MLAIHEIIPTRNGWFPPALGHHGPAPNGGHCADPSAESWDPSAEPRGNDTSPSDRCLRQRSWCSRWLAADGCWVMGWAGDGLVDWLAEHSRDGKNASSLARLSVNHVWIKGDTGHQWQCNQLVFVH